MPIARYVEDDSTIPLADQFLRSLPMLRHPVSFELLGVGPQPIYDTEPTARIFEDRANGIDRPIDIRISDWKTPYISTQFVAHKADVRRVERQLLTHYPESAATTADAVSDDLISIVADVAAGQAYGGTLALASGYCMSLRAFSRLSPDPIGVAVSAMDRLGREQWGLLQILFQPTRYPWQTNLEAALTDPYTNDFLVTDVDAKMLQRKFRSPLFAVSVRILAEARKYKLVLAGLANQYVGQPTPSVRAAIFGKVGSMLTFRLGTGEGRCRQKWAFSRLKKSSTSKSARPSAASGVRPRPSISRPIPRLPSNPTIRPGRSSTCADSVTPVQRKRSSRSLRSIRYSR